MQPVAESCGDFIAEEMNARGLRNPDLGDAALFRGDTPEADFQRAVIAALDRWLLSAPSDRTHDDIEGYARPCGE